MAKIYLCGLLLSTLVTSLLSGCGGAGNGIDDSHSVVGYAAAGGPVGIGKGAGLTQLSGIVTRIIKWGTASTAGTSIIPSDPESYFYISPSGATSVQ